MTAQIQKRFKMLFGKSVIIGQMYIGITTDSIKTDMQYKPLLFERSTLLCVAQDNQFFIFLSGDIAAFKGRIYADKVLTQIHLNAPVEAGTTIENLRKRYYKIPPTFLKMILKGVT